MVWGICWGLTCDWLTDLGNGCVVFGTCVTIGWASVCRGKGIGWFVLTFLFNPALPWPILGLGMGCVGCPLSMSWIGNEGDGFCLPGLTCVSKLLSAPCTSGNLIPLAFYLWPGLYWILVGFGLILLISNSIEMIICLTTEYKGNRNEFVQVAVICLLSR